jgi:hypothetical protein
LSEQVFADGIGPIVVVGGTVRLDFLTFVPDEGEAGSRPKPVVEHRLFMPVEAFMMASRRISEAAEAIAKLEREQGVTRAAAPAPAPVPPPAPAPTPVAPAPVAPPPEPSHPQMVASEAPPVDRPKPPFP